MARRGIHTAVRRVSKRLTEWFITVDSAGFINVAAASKLLYATVPGATLALIAPATIIRTRGILTVLSDQTAATETQMGGIGVGFVNEVAGTLGITALPGPTTDPNWEGWFVYQRFTQRMLVATAVGMASRGGSGGSYEIDSKAMRKFDGDETMVFLAENRHATNGFEFNLVLRFLVKAG